MIETPNPATVQPALMIEAFPIDDVERHSARLCEWADLVGAAFDGAAGTMTMLVAPMRGGGTPADLETLAAIIGIPTTATTLTSGLARLVDLSTQ